MRQLREPTYYILASLIDEPRHGWSIIQEAADLSQGRIRLTAGTLYGALDRLQTEGLVEQDREEIVNGRCRRYYRLTAPGHRLLREEAARLAASAHIVQKRLSSAPPAKVQGAAS
ncbi:MAG: helix-turn-helix transcriptional regulator [Thermoleophilia bacterium]|nr:helix-turn-helix transcriptional regulator [Thermoleophilia bacterium]